MDEIKKIMKGSIITSAIILVYGIIIQEKMVYLGMFIGSLVSILSFYMICIDVKSIILLKGSYKAGILSYLKRYALYTIVLSVSGYFFDAGMLLSTTIGLLNVKFNIYLMVLYKTILKLKKKYLK